jgi:hypothetical protein
MVGTPILANFAQSDRFLTAPFISTKIGMDELLDCCFGVAHLTLSPNLRAVHSWHEPQEYHLSLSILSRVVPLGRSPINSINFIGPVLIASQTKMPRLP